MRIEVTLPNIREGGHNCTWCPIHRALGNVGLPAASISSSSVVFENGVAYAWDRLGLSSVCLWILAYDSNGGHFVEPFTFNLSAEAVMTTKPI